MTIFIWLIFGVIWLITAGLDYARYGYVWQLKEYRLRNMCDYLSNRKRRQLIFNFFYFRQTILRPKLTNKMVLIIAFSCGFEIIVLYFWFSPWTIPILILIRFLVISTVVGLLYIPTLLVKKFYIYRASTKLARYKELIVIGITGSYGKTTVKEFLAQVLSGKFSVIKTPEHINTEIGIARFILKTDFIKTEIFVVEMGAYKPGDIKIIAEMVKPEIGILTAINEQHLALFGSLKKTQATKYELLQSLPADGLAVVNSDNDLCREPLDKLNTKSVTFGMDRTWQPQYHITDIATSMYGIQFKCNERKYTSQVVGSHNAMNLAPVVAVAEHLGMQNNEIQPAIKDLKLPLKNTQLCSLNKSLIIDDSHNANPDGFLVALKLLKTVKNNQRTVVITRGMNELGTKSAEIHRSVAKKIAEIADVLVIISPDYEESLRTGTNEKIDIKTIFNGADLLQYIKQLSSAESLVLFENRLFANVDEYIKNNSKEFVCKK